MNLVSPGIPLKNVDVSGFLGQAPPRAAQSEEDARMLHKEEEHARDLC